MIKAGTPPTQYDHPVAIIGGGPVGMALALLLDYHGVRSVLFNSEATSRTYPRGNTHNARTMEHYRRIGIADAIRQLGLPADHPTDAAYFTRYGNYELARIPMPSTRQKLREVADAPPDDQVPEPLHRANQMYVEAFLLERIRTRPNIALRFGWHVDQASQDAVGVTIQARSAADDIEETWRADFAVGCDGGRGLIRRTLDIPYSGEAGLQQEVYGGRATAAYLRLPTLYRDCLGNRRAWNYWAINADLSTNLIPLNGRDEFFLLTSSVDPDRSDPVEIVRLVQSAAGAEIPVDVLDRRGWNPGVALVAERYRADRVFLAGDAAHLFTPTGGFGMNTGIDDAANLAWKLAAVVHGWASPALLDSYELERRPIGERNTAAARSLTARLGTLERPPELEDDSARGEDQRRRVGAVLAGYGSQFASVGVQLGARYDGSPLIVADGDPPADDFLQYRASSVPGGRAPHLWLNAFRGPRSSLFDRFGSGFTLLRLGPRPPAGTALEHEARAMGVPLKVVDVPDEAARDLYERDLALIRPDHHVAWRGNQQPDDSGRLLGTVSGRHR